MFCSDGFVYFVYGYGSFQNSQEFRVLFGCLTNVTGIQGTYTNVFHKGSTPGIVSQAYRTYRNSGCETYAGYSNLFLCSTEPHLFSYYRRSGYE